MTPQEHAEQRARVVGSLQADEGREHKHDVYSRRPGEQKPEPDRDAQ